VQSERDSDSLSPLTRCTHTEHHETAAHLSSYMSDVGVSPLLGSEIVRVNPLRLAESSDLLNPEVVTLALFLISSTDITSMVRPEGSSGSFSLLAYGPSFNIKLPRRTTRSGQLMKLLYRLQIVFIRSTKEIKEIQEMKFGFTRKGG
jgi:hypothetical protein